MTGKDWRRHVGDGMNRLEAPGTGREEFVLPPYGFLERITLEPAEQEFLPNMDSTRPFRLLVALIDGDGNPVPLRVSEWCRTVNVE